LVKYIDGNVKKEIVHPDGRREFQVEPWGLPIPVAPLQPRYPDWFYQQIVDQIGSKIRVVEH